MSPKAGLFLAGAAVVVGCVALLGACSLSSTHFAGSISKPTPSFSHSFPRAASTSVTASLSLSPAPTVTSQQPLLATVAESAAAVAAAPTVAASHNPMTTSLPTSIRLGVDPILAVLREHGKQCQVRETDWIFPSADSGATITCASERITIYHYPNQDGQEWLSVNRDFMPAGPHGYANNGYVLINYFSHHDLDPVLYQVIDSLG